MLIITKNSNNIQAYKIKREYFFHTRRLPMNDIYYSPMFRTKEVESWSDRHQNVSFVTVTAITECGLCGRQQ